MRPDRVMFREGTIANLTSNPSRVEPRCYPTGVALLTIFVLPILLAFSNSSSAQTSTTAKSAVNPAAAVYRQLTTVGLDPKQIYNVRDASIDREDIHLSLDEGT